MKASKKIKTTILLTAVLLILLSLVACVDQGGGQPKAGTNNGNPRVIATSMATVYIMEKLDVDLIAVPDSMIDKLPQRYEGLEKTGMAMTPDIEKIKSLNPDYVFSPVTLISDLLPKYEQAGLNYGFVNLSNIPGMYKTIEDLGQLLGKEKEAKALVDQYQSFMEEYQNKHKDKAKPKVLVLMGLPGSYVAATENSYAGSLVELAGGENVYQGSDQQFLTINSEDMLKKDPDIILRTAHAMPEDVMEMFRDEFKTNDIWSHFRAVKEDQVYDLDYNKFGMSAKFNYPQALEDLEEIFYEGKD